MAEAETRGAAIDLPRIEAASTGRLDRVLAEALPDFSRTRLKQIILAGGVRVGSVTERDPAARISAGAALFVSVAPVAPAKPEAEPITLHILFEDTDVLVLDKPAGLVVHPGAGVRSGTLVNALIAHCGATLSGVGGVARPGIVHRLDKGTSGLMVVAKTDFAHRALSAQFADHGASGALERAYLALIWGVPDRRQFSIDRPIARSSSNRERMEVAPEGKGRRAVTHIHVLETWRRGSEPLASLARCRLETGRTHQIRVHLASVRHPVVGDPLYATGFRTKARRLSEGQREALASLDRQALHAGVLGFEHPRTGARMRFASDPPADFERLLRAFRTDG